MKDEQRSTGNAHEAGRTRPLAEQRPADRLWRRWVLANAIATAVGPLLLDIATHPYRGDSRVFWAVLATGIALGTAQWVALKQSPIRSPLWIAATAAGFVTSLAVNMVFNILEPPGLWALVKGSLERGAAMGLLQFLLLFRRVRRAAWWIPTSIVGTPLVVLAQSGSVIVFDALVRGGGMFEYAIKLVSSGAIGGAAGGCVTGWVLSQLLRHPGDAVLLEPPHRNVGEAADGQKRARPASEGEPDEPHFFVDPPVRPNRRKILPPLAIAFASFVVLSLLLVAIFTVAKYIAGGTASESGSPAQALMRPFAGRWQGPDRFYIEVRADGTVKSLLPVTMSESKIKAEPGLLYQEGNWAVYGDGTCYSMTVKRNGLEYRTDEKTFCLRPDYTSIKLLEKHRQGNLYAKQLIGTVTLNGDARVVADALEVTVPVASHAEGKATTGKASATPEKAVLVRATMREGKLCLAAVDLMGFAAQCYGKIAAATSKQGGAMRREDSAAAAPALVVPSGPSPPPVAPGVQSSRAARRAESSVSTPALGSSLSPKAAPSPESGTPQEGAVRRIEVNSTLQVARLIRQPKPVYPPLARRARIEGTVQFKATIGEDGTVRSLQLLSGHPLLVPAAQEAVKQWVYTPTLIDGKVVEVVTHLEVHFRLEPETGKSEAEPKGES